MTIAICSSGLFVLPLLSMQIDRPYVKILEETTILSNERDRIKRLVGIEQYEQNFTCQFQANPPPTSIYWITDGTTIVSRKKSKAARERHRLLHHAGRLFRGEIDVSTSINLGTQWSLQLHR